MRYAENPFVEVNEVRPGVWVMRSPGFSPSLMYLVEGTEGALLIDTGYGIGRIRPLIERLTKLPYQVAVTHAHGDHTLGNSEFPQVFAHSAAVQPIRGNDEPDVRARFTAIPDRSDVNYAPGDFVPAGPYELIPIEAGHVFDLGGGHELEAISVPGHTFGCICLLERKRRMLFTGDAIVFTPTFIFNMGGGGSAQPTVRDYLASLQALLPRVHEFDALYPGHSEIGLNPEMIPEMIACCEEIIADPDVGEPFAYRPELAKLHAHGRASIAYSGDRI